MILRRITEHVKAQNWTAVALDFVIVVTGILIAFQITEWNEEQETRAREFYVIRQLASDIDAIEEQAHLHVEIYRSKVASADRSMAFIASGLESPEDEPALLDDINNVMFRRSPVGRSPAFVELISSGDLGIIRDDELRDALTRFDLEMQAGLRADEVVTDFWFRYSENLGRKIILADSLGESFGGARYSVGNYDLVAMRSDPEFQSSLSWIKRMHIIAADLNRNIADRAGAIAERLEAARQ